MNHAQASVWFEMRYGIIGTAVINDHDLIGGTALRTSRIDGLGQPGTTVADRY
jgi:hypothetical protein|tara:strand:+ start:712 stop:870 length:159 start_codon:yes stop_codon:yes gene_type:complete